MSKSIFKEAMLENFKIQCPWTKDHIVKSEPFSSMQLLVELDDGSKVLYDYAENSFRYIQPYPTDNEEEIEKRWRQEFALRLRSKMYEKAMGQEELSNITGISRTMISHYITGKYIPNIYNTSKLAKAFGCTVDELLRFPKY